MKTGEATDQVYAFVATVEQAHRVASHIYLQGPPGVIVGFNESKRGEGYVVAGASVDIAQTVREVTGEDPIRVLTAAEVLAEPDIWGVQAIRAEELGRRDSHDDD